VLQNEASAQTTSRYSSLITYMIDLLSITYLPVQMDVCSLQRHVENTISTWLRRRHRETPKHLSTQIKELVDCAGDKGCTRYF
jgi:hypothetical protein